MNPAAQTVRARVALAGRLRRARETGRRLWQGAPIAAAICAGVAAGARWIGWSGLVSIGVVAIALIVLAAYVLSARRDRAISDSTAAELDGLAHLGGELRSASWFASRDEPPSTQHTAPSTQHAAPTTDSWVDFHLARAAERLQSTDWTALYPPVRAARAKAATALLAVLALILVLPVAGRAGVHAVGSATPAARSAAAADADLALLPPELLKKLQDLLKEAERAGKPGATVGLTPDQFRDLLSKLDAAKDQKAEQDAKRGLDPNAKQMGAQAQELKDLAERLKRAATLDALSPEVRDAMKEVAEKLSEMNEQQASSLKDPQDASGSAEAPQGDAAQAKKDANKFDDSSVKSVKDASAGGGAGVIMMSADEPQGAQEAGLGLGGASSDRKGGGTMPGLMAALKKETIEAYKDDAGENTTIDNRRKTERGTATVAYSATPPAAFEKGRATAPPAVPEKHRAAVQTYFIRKQ
jgi:hypothetical protein